MSAVALGAGLGVAAVIALIVLLIAKELSSAEGEGDKNEKLRNLASILTIPIASLMLVFVFIVATKIWEVL